MTHAMTRTRVFLVFSSACLAVSFGCITPKEKKDMQNDLFNVQTRLLGLERTLTDSTSKATATGEGAAKRVASAQADMERLSRDIQQIRGDIDALKIGVTTGHLPGAEAGEETLGGKLDSIAERLEAVEQSQEELLGALKKAGLNAPKGKGKEADKGIASAKDLQKAYDKKQYKQVADEAPKILKKADDKDKETIMWLNAEALFKLGKHREAALKYNDFIEAKPAEAMLPVAKMRIGDCFRSLGDGETAKVYYEELIKEFPDSDEAAKAKERLAAGGSGNEKG